MGEVKKSAARTFFDRVCFIRNHYESLKDRKEGFETDFTRNIVKIALDSLFAYTRQVELKMLRMGNPPTEWNIEESIRQNELEHDRLMALKAEMDKNKQPKK